jgi:hypothetical protein
MIDTAQALNDSTQQSIAFGVLKAAMKRQLTLKELPDIMLRVSQLAITSRFVNGDFQICRTWLRNSNLAPKHLASQLCSTFPAAEEVKFKFRMKDLLAGCDVKLTPKWRRQWLPLAGISLSDGGIGVQHIKLTVLFDLNARHRFESRNI